MTENEFRILTTAILKEIIIGKSVYCSTSPQELKRYMNFVHTMKKYDVVIDGLNVAYAACRKQESMSPSNKNSNNKSDRRASLKNVIFL